jgi:hypothetical protein
MEHKTYEKAEKTRYFFSIESVDVKRKIATVTQKRDKNSGEWLPPIANWSAWGNCNSAELRAFKQGIEIAQSKILNRLHVYMGNNTDNKFIGEWEEII